MDSHQARRVTRAFFRGEFNALSASELDDVFEGAASIEVEKCDIDTHAPSPTKS